MDDVEWDAIHTYDNSLESPICGEQRGLVRTDFILQDMEVNDYHDASTRDFKSDLFTRSSDHEEYNDCFFLEPSNQPFGTWDLVVWATEYNEDPIWGEFPFGHDDVQIKEHNVSHEDTIEGANCGKFGDDLEHKSDLSILGIWLRV